MEFVQPVPLKFANADAAPDYQRADIFKQLTKRLLPDLNMENTTRWMGIRPSFPENLPAICPLEKHSGVIAAFGHSHYGMGMAPAIARLVTVFASERKFNSGLSTFRPERFM